MRAEWRAAHARMRALVDADYPVTPGSPWPSELAALVLSVDQHQVEVLVEGGTSLGQAAWVLGTLLKGVMVKTIEIDPMAVRMAVARLMPLPNVEVIDGDAYRLLPVVVANACLGGRRCGVFLDGPKGTAALPLVQSLVEDTRLTNLRFIAVHDTYQSVAGRPNPIRCGLFDLGWHTRGWTCWATDQASWVEEMRDLDRGLYGRRTAGSRTSNSFTASRLSRPRTDRL
jgi:hypothetical protein